MGWSIVVIVAAVTVIGLITALTIIKSTKNTMKGSDYRPGYQDVIVRDAVDVIRQQFVYGGEGGFAGSGADVHTVLDSEDMLRWNIIFADNRTGKMYRCSFTGSMIVGRRPSSGTGKPGFAVENDNRVSKKHCMITSGKRGLIIRDLGSRNGTRVNGKLLTEDVRLRTGDRLGVGDSEFTVKVIRE